MPNLKVHCDISKRRTGETYEDLHKWMDEATEYLGANHRLERHFFTAEYKDYISRTWGAKAVVEWLFHIAIDNLETANKFAVDVYNKNFEEIDIKFDGKMVSQCNFIKTTSNGNKKTFEISVNGKDDINRIVKEKVVKEEPKEEKPKKKFFPYRRRF